MIGMMFPSALAESDYSKIKVKDATTQILEFDKYKVIRISLTVENDDSEKFQTYNKYLTADDTIHYETSSSSDIDEIGNKTCPSNSIEINPGLEEDYIFCFQVPKSFSNNFKLKFMSTNSERCAEASTNQYITCQESTYPLSSISNPIKISYESLLKTYVDNFQNIDASISNIELIPASDNNVLVMTLSISNTGNSEINGYSIDITAKNISGLEFETGYSELTYEQRRNLDCNSSIEDINPGLTKTSVLCFEVPKNETAFNLVLRSDFGSSLSDCDNNYRVCNELFINIIAPAPATPAPATPAPATPAPATPAPESTGIASFVDQSKDPQHYIDRYNNEPTYKEWFDENYSQYSSIYQAVGLEEPQIASPSNNMSYSLYADPEKNFSLKYPSTWIITESDSNNESKVSFQDSDDWTIHVMVFDLGIIPGIDKQTDDERYYGTYGGESLACKLATFETDGYICYGIEPFTHASITLDSGEYVHNLAYVSTREYAGFNTPILFNTITTDFTKYNHVWQLVFNIDTTNPSSFDESMTFPIINSITESFKILHEQSKTPEPSHLRIASFVDQSKDPQSYVDRYNNEPIYKEWFDENYSQYSSIYQAVGLEEPVVVYTPEPTVEVASTPTCGAGTESVNGICKVIQTEEKSSKGGGCLIATATYGSEMATEVQQLRELRDNQLMNTEYGTAFMSTFNDIYYSFSPVIADYERENPMFKEAVKIAITPMISSLSLMDGANSESEVLGLGLSVIVLNIGMYLGVPAIVVIGIRTRI